MITQRRYGYVAYVFGSSLVALVMALGFGSVASAQVADLVCTPATQNVTLGGTATVNATGGTGSYTWSAPELDVTNPTGSGFIANYATTGTKTITVMSGNDTATCTVHVLAASAPTTPGVPATGAGLDPAAVALMALAGVMIAGGLGYLLATRRQASR